MSLIQIDSARCLKDGLCARLCRKVFSGESSGSVPKVEREESCNSCGHCVMICPSGAISHSDCPPERLHEVQNSLMPAYDQVRELMATRRSTRRFRDKPVERDIIEKIVDCARYAPSAKNSQSTRYLVIQDKILLGAIASATSEWLGKISKRLKNPLLRKLYLLVGQEDGEVITRWIKEFEFIAEQMRRDTDLILFKAPALILFHADRADRFGDQNANLAIQNGTLAAHSLSLGSFYTGYIVTAMHHDKSIHRLTKLPARQKVYAGLAIGYPEIRFSRWIERNAGEIEWR
jgi:nitroreductase/NAD-dependent dihydropyrimidine dehydrogenase PreA subunit